jgi:hypothetical protein
MSEIVFSVHDGYFCAWDNPSAMREPESQGHFTVSVSAGFVSNTVGLCLLPEELATQQYPDFLAAVLLGL